MIEAHDATWSGPGTESRTSSMTEDYLRRVE